jgi:prepilin-type processing-associated H-X9-DG protein
MICPSDGTPSTDIDGVDAPNNCVTVAYSYSSSDEAGGATVAGQPVGLGMGASLASFEALAQLYLAFDVQGYYAAPEGNIDNFAWRPTQTDFNSVFASRHNGLVNCAFCDGHVKALKCSDMFPCERGEWIGGSPGSSKQSLLEGAGCWNSGWVPTYTTENGQTRQKNTCP